jgi:dihydrofolate reductase
MKMSVTVDGFVGNPNCGNEWIFKSSDETSRAWSVKQSYDAGLIIMGRKSFDAMAPYWVTATGGFATPMNAVLNSN